MDLNPILNWTLKAGSHDFPGPAGGTCINEAAIVAAGFEYKKIAKASDCPPCFSRPISAFAIAVNDGMPDDLRNELLMPFVLRLAGTADSPEVEYRRAKYMIVQIARRMIGPILREGGRPDLAAPWEACETLQQVQQCALDLARALARDLARDLALDRDLARALARALDLARDRDLDVARDLARALARDLARDLDRDLARALADFRRRLWVAATEILDEAIKLGRQAEPIEVAAIKARTDAARTLAAVS
jgi:hypothetical protein